MNIYADHDRLTQTFFVKIKHRDEIEYVFGVPLNPSSNFTENEKNLSRRMMDYWTTFAKSG